MDAFAAPVDDNEATVFARVGEALCIPFGGESDDGEFIVARMFHRVITLPQCTDIF